MPRIKTDELLDRITAGEFKTVRLTGLREGGFCMTPEDKNEFFIHENKDGSIKEYPKVEYALDWLKRKSVLRKVEIDFALWKERG